MNPINKPITNPMLCGTIELMKAEDTPEHRNMFLDEMVRARFIAPVLLDPIPTPDENGRVKLDPGCKVQFPMLSSKDGKQFFMAFTDWEELKKWNAQDGQQTFVLGFDDYAGMLFRKDKEGNTSPALGFVINPFSSNVFVSKAMVAQIMTSRMAKSGIPMPKVTPAAAEAAEAEVQESAEEE